MEILPNFQDVKTLA